MIARLALPLVVLSVSPPAHADGERTPMIGIAGLAAETQRTPDATAALGGFAVDVASWHGRFGLAAEASGLWSIDDTGGRAYILGASARLRLVQGMMTSPVEPRDIEAALELHAIAERAWWSGAPSTADPIAYGLGLALRLRGGGDPDGSTLLAESRFFLRVMSSRWNQLDAIARTMEPVPTTSPRSLTVMVGIGASFGSGTPDYVRKFRLRPFEPTLL